MKIIALSDIHTFYNKVTIPDGDVLVFAGDFSFQGSGKEIYNYIIWLNSLPHKHKLWIPGNHELGLEDFPHNIEVIENETDSICIHDKMHEIDGVKFFGSAFTPQFNNWAFMHSERQRIIYWENAPIDVDILVTHGPPYGILDTGGKLTSLLGCWYLYEYVERVKPKVHIFGHIHEGAGEKIKEWGNGSSTAFYNVTMLDRNYDVRYKPKKIIVND